MNHYSYVKSYCSIDDMSYCTPGGISVDPFVLKWNSLAKFNVLRKERIKIIFTSSTIYYYENLVYTAATMPDNTPGL